MRNLIQKWQLLIIVSCVACSNSTVTLANFVTVKTESKTVSSPVQDTSKDITYAQGELYSTT